MRARPAVLALAALLALSAAPAMAHDPEAGAAEGVWVEHAATDEEAAREGRAAMPFTTEQIEALGRLLRETQAAAAQAADPPPESTLR